MSSEISLLKAQNCTPLPLGDLTSSSFELSLLPYTCALVQYISDINLFTESCTLAMYRFKELAYHIKKINTI